jgi:hypothetical protein
MTRSARTVSLLFFVGLAAGCAPSRVDPYATSSNARKDAGTSSVAPTAPAQVDAAGADASAKTDADAERVITEGTATWRSVPNEQNGYWAALDGICSELRVARVGPDFVLSYGGSSPLYANVRQGPASLAGLRQDRLVAIGRPEIVSPTGVAGTSLDDLWIADSTGMMSDEDAVLHRYDHGTWKVYRKDQTNLHRWLDGGIIGTLGVFAHDGEIWVEGTPRKPPASLASGLGPIKQLAAFPTGDVLVLGRPIEPPSAPLVARHWAPGKNMTTHSLAKLLPGDEYPRLLEIAPDEIYVASGPRVIRWDGSAFRPVGATKGDRDIVRLHRVARDELLVETRPQGALDETVGLSRIGPEGAVAIATPEPFVSLDGVEVGTPWGVGASGVVYRREGETWTKRPLPPAPFSTSGIIPKAKGVVAAGPDDMLIVAKYWEKAPSWREQELHTALFRTKPVRETLRCNEPDPENDNVNVGRGFQSWPPLATPACKTPFVVLARRSNAVKKVDDWPRLRAAFKGHAELGDVTLVEIISGDRTFVGAKAASFGVAKKMMALATKNERLRPEVVCAEPEAVRTLPLDLATGNVVAR